jgi:branched-chain amino acid transport system substrate-binding protein
MVRRRRSTIVDVPNSGVALAVNEVAREKNKVFLVSGAASSDLDRARNARRTRALDL